MIFFKFSVQDEAFDAEPNALEPLPLESYSYSIFRREKTGEGMQDNAIQPLWDFLSKHEKELVFYK
jgi:hypothetical protein